MLRYFPILNFASRSEVVVKVCASTSHCYKKTIDKNFYKLCIILVRGKSPDSRGRLKPRQFTSRRCLKVTSYLSLSIIKSSFYHWMPYFMVLPQSEFGIKMLAGKSSPDWVMRIYKCYTCHLKILQTLLVQPLKGQRLDNFTSISHPKLTMMELGSLDNQ